MNLETGCAWTQHVFLVWNQWRSQEFSLSPKPPEAIGSLGRSPLRWAISWNPYSRGSCCFV